MAESKPENPVSNVDDPDHDLLVAAKERGDEKAMERLYRRHAPAIHAYALRATHNADAADDITQETFVRAFRSLDRFEGRSSFRTWVFTIAVNRVRTHIRRRPDVNVDLDAAELSVEPRTSTSWLAKQLSKALSRLPEGYREVVIMHDVLGMEHDEIAGARRCSVGTSKSQLHKARAKLRSLLGKSHEPILG